MSYYKAPPRTQRTYGRNTTTAKRGGVEFAPTQHSSSLSQYSPTDENKIRTNRCYSIDSFFGSSNDDCKRKIEEERTIHEQRINKPRISSPGEESVTGSTTIDSSSSSSSSLLPARKRDAKSGRGTKGGRGRNAAEKKKDLDQQLQQSMRDAFSSGNQEDIKLLCDSIDKYRTGASSISSGLTVTLPSSWSDHQKQRSREWLNTLQFEDSQLSTVVLLQLVYMGYHIMDVEALQRLAHACVQTQQESAEHKSQISALFTPSCSIQTNSASFGPDAAAVHPASILSQPAVGDQIARRRSISFNTQPQQPEALVGFPVTVTVGSLTGSNQVNSTERRPLTLQIPPMRDRVLNEDRSESPLDAPTPLSSSSPFPFAASNSNSSRCSTRSQSADTAAGSFSRPNSRPTSCRTVPSPSEYLTRNMGSLALGSQSTQENADDSLRYSGEDNVPILAPNSMTSRSRCNSRSVVVINDVVHEGTEEEENGKLDDADGEDEEEELVIAFMASTDSLTTAGASASATAATTTAATAATTTAEDEDAHSPAPLSMKTLVPTSSVASMDDDVAAAAEVEVEAEAAPTRLQQLTRKPSASDDIRPAPPHPRSVITFEPVDPAAAADQSTDASTIVDSSHDGIEALSQPLGLSIGSHDSPLIHPAPKLVSHAPFAAAAPPLVSGSLMEPSPSCQKHGTPSTSDNSIGQFSMPPRWLAAANPGSVDEADADDAWHLGVAVAGGQELSIDHDALRKYDIKPSRGRSRRGMHSKRREKNQQLTRNNRSHTAPPMFLQQSNGSGNHESPDVNQALPFSQNDASDMHCTPVLMRTLDHVYSWESSEIADALCLEKLKSALHTLRKKHFKDAMSTEVARSAAYHHASPGTASGLRGSTSAYCINNMAFNPDSKIGVSSADFRTGYPLRRANSELASNVRHAFAPPGELIAPFHPPHSHQQQQQQFQNHPLGAVPDPANMFSPGQLARASLENCNHFRGSIPLSTIRNTPSTSSSSQQQQSSIGCFSAVAWSTLGETDKLKRKLLKSKAKQRRMSSICPRRSVAGAVSKASLHKHPSASSPDHHAGVMDEVSTVKPPRSSSVFSPIAKSKFNVGIRARRRRSTCFKQLHKVARIDEDTQHSDVFNSSSGSAQSHAGAAAGWEQQSDMSIDHEHSYVAGHSPNSAPVHPLPASQPASLPVLNEMNFKGVVIGGVYQHCFDGTFPLVAAPASSDKRVVNVLLAGDGSVTLSLYLPKDSISKHIELGREWQCSRCSPIGYLISRGTLKPHSAVVCYYLPKHPRDWYQSLDLVEQPAAATASHPEFAMEVDYRPLRDSTVEVHDGDDVIDIDEHDFHDVGEIELDTSGDHYHHAAVDGQRDAMDAVAAHCSNPALLALILDFLVMDGGVNSSTVNAVSTATQISTRSTRSRAVVSNRKVEHTDPSAGSYQCVSKAWALSVSMIIAKRHSEISIGSDRQAKQFCFDYSRFCKFLTSHHDGKFLSQGVCKDVYSVRNAHEADRLEAVSVMDLRDLRKRDMEGAVAQELHIAMVCSALNSMNICPNLVEVYSAFQCDYGAPVDVLWSSSAGAGKNGKKSVTLKLAGDLGPNLLPAAELPRKSDLRCKPHQFLRMEFCTGGDLEAIVRRAQQLDVDVVRSFLFQMCFCLYACREKIALRHFDIKLLNFFATSGANMSQKAHTCTNTNTNAIASPNRSSQTFQIGFGHHVYSLPLHASNPTVVKLADFGTSIMGSAGLGDPITVQQFTTLENTPPEFLLLGSLARQSYSADTFPLGLCMLHLLTGLEPYEELMKDVHCPRYLAEVLKAFWCTEDPDSPYFVVSEVISSLDPDSYDVACPDFGAEQILMDTLYRYVVLFGASIWTVGLATPAAENEARALDEVYHESDVWKALVATLGLRCGNSDLEGSTAADYMVGTDYTHLHVSPECQQQYQQDALRWSVRIGNHPIIMSTRTRLEQLGADAGQLLESLVHFDPARRCSMYDVLKHPVFYSLRLPNGLNTDASSLQFMHYHRSKPEHSMAHQALYRDHNSNSNHSHSFTSTGMQLLLQAEQDQLDNLPII